MPARSACVIVLAVLALAGAARGQEKPGPVGLTVHKLGAGTYWVEGGASNTGFLVGDKGVVVVDAQMTVDAAHAVVADIAAITPKPVDTIVLTHGDPDHVGGLPGYAGVKTIVAQENVKSSMRVAGENGARWGARLLPLFRSLANFTPTRTLGPTQTMDLDGVRAVLIHVAPAHTSGDVVVYLPAQKIVFAGDIVTTSPAVGRFPIIHPGGSSLGWIAMMQAILDLDARTIVPGHGAIESKPLLRVRLEKAQQRRSAVKALVEQGRSLAEVEAALPDSVPGSRFPTFTQVVYEELTRGYPPAG